VSPREGWAWRDLGMAAGGALLGAALVLSVVTVLGVEGPTCRPRTDPERSVAREFNDVLLEAIRRDVPAPTVHARTLFHTSVAMWDAWAAFDPQAIGYLVDEDHTAAADIDAARDEAISYAAYRVLEHRYLTATGGSDSVPRFAEVMAARCYPVTVTTTDGPSPAALGNRIAAAVLAHGLNDGANEAGRYAPPEGYTAVNAPLVVAEPGAGAVDPDRWQPLQLELMLSQNGIPVADGVQSFVGPHWGYVSGFALPVADLDGLPMDPGPPPAFGDPRSHAAYVDGVLEVVDLSSRLDPRQAPTIDASPGTIGGNPLGSDDGDGHDRNPATGRPYDPNLVNEADFLRVVAEYWADGPSSETPPGHWNTIANQVSDALAPDLRIGGRGPVVDRLEWDVKLYLALNAANHDAAIAAWGVKGHYDYARPITMIRHLASLGQSSDPAGPAYHPDGLPLVPGLIEVVMPDSTRPGARHAHLAGHEREVAVRAWTGQPEDPEHDLGGVDWVLGATWIPYQAATFVSPAFAAYVSGHSTFSHAAAVVLTDFTGDAYFPGGLHRWRVPAGGLEFEVGPERAVELQWATYADAADQAGRSRRYSGIHVVADDVAGRLIGARCGAAVWEKVQHYYTGATDGA
jgi:hypothetical protein